MSTWKSFWLNLLRYLVLLLAVGPIVGVILVWAWMASHGPSPARAEAFDRGNLMLALLMATAGVGIALELMLTPLLRRDLGRRHWASRARRMKIARKAREERQLSRALPDSIKPPADRR